MKDGGNPELKEYFAQADSWARDRQADAKRSRTIAWSVAAAAATIAVCEALALVALTPLKTVQPYTLLVDRQTGFVQALKPLDPQLISSKAALTQSFLVQYVIAREEFDISTLNADYRKVATWSGGPARSEYLARMQISNPDSPLAGYPRSLIMDVEVKSVTPLSEGVALVRFSTVQRSVQNAQPAQSWVSVIRFGYSLEAMSAADRFINPLGFHVTGYRRSAEVISGHAGDRTDPAQNADEQQAASSVITPRHDRVFTDIRANGAMPSTAAK